MTTLTPNHMFPRESPLDLTPIKDQTGSGRGYALHRYWITLKSLYYQLSTLRSRGHDVSPQDHSSKMEGDNSLGSSTRSTKLPYRSIVILACSVSLLYLACDYRLVLHDTIPDQEADKVKFKRIFSYTREPIKQIQIQNYIDNHAIIYNIHITHHAGTSLCGAMRSLGPTPDFACMAGKNWPDEIPKTKYWPSNTSTSALVQQVLPHFHFVSAEFSTWKHSDALQRIDWEDHNLVSMVVMRNPMDRFLANGRCEFRDRLKGDPTEFNQDIWWEYANAECADNFALRSLSGIEECCSMESLKRAKRLLERFTFIIDQECLDESLTATIELLNATDRFELSQRNQARYDKKHEHKSARERIGNDTLWEFLKNKFRRDIALYEWSKNRSVVRCGH